MTLTVRHTRRHRLAPLMDGIGDALSEACRRAKGIRWWADAEWCGGIDYVWTVSGGHHPHWHIVVALPYEVEPERIRADLWGVWRDAVSSSMPRAHRPLERCANGKPLGVHVARWAGEADDATDVAWYAWGIAGEVAAPKSSRRGGSHTATELLDEAVTAPLWVEVVNAMYRRRRFRSMRGLAGHAAAIREVERATDPLDTDRERARPVALVDPEASRWIEDAGLADELSRAAQHSPGELAQWWAIRGRHCPAGRLVVLTAESRALYDALRAAEWLSWWFSGLGDTVFVQATPNVYVAASASRTRPRGDPAGWGSHCWRIAREEHMGVV